MSLTIIKGGVLDTVQDGGRYGWQHLGINPGGAMDTFAMQVVNLLVGNGRKEAVIELHFPAATFLFGQDAMIAIGGADFSPSVGGQEIPLWQPVIMAKGSILQFKQAKSGARAYLAIREGLQVSDWLASASTNLKAKAGGFHGRALLKGDVLGFKKEAGYSSLLKGNDFFCVPWRAGIQWHLFEQGTVLVIPGREWDWLDAHSQHAFFNNSFAITALSDRMGYKLSGPPLAKTTQEELVSSAVSVGTIQLLPNGQLIVLMADHQTTGGYPRIAHVITAQLSRLAQAKPEERLTFRLTDIQTAEELLIKQERHTRQLESACSFRLQQFLNTR